MLASTHRRESFWNVLLKFEIKYRFANGVNWTYRTGRPYFKIEGTDGWVYADFSNRQGRASINPAVSDRPQRSPFSQQERQTGLHRLREISRRNSGTSRSWPPSHLTMSPGPYRYPEWRETRLGPRARNVSPTTTPQTNGSINRSPNQSTVKLFAHAGAIAFATATRTSLYERRHRMLFQKRIMIITVF